MSVVNLEDDPGAYSPRRSAKHGLPSTKAELHTAYADNISASITTGTTA